MFALVMSDKHNEYHTPAQNFLRCVECHRKTGDEKICKCETHEEIIVNSPQLGIEDNTEYDQEVGEDGHDDDGYQGYPLHNRLHVEIDIKINIRKIGTIRGKIYATVIFLLHCWQKSVFSLINI